MNDTITIEEFLDHMQFSENRKKAASAVNVNYEHWMEDHAERVTEMTIFGPEIRYKTNLGHSYIQLKFIDEKNADYRRLSYFCQNTKLIWMIMQRMKKEKIFQH